MPLLAQPASRAISTAKPADKAARRSPAISSALGRNTFNKLIDGERLTPEQRAAFVKQAEQLHSARRAKYDAASARYRALAEKQGASPDDVTGASAQAPVAGGFVTLVDENGEELDVSPDKVDAILKKHSNLRRK